MKAPRTRTIQTLTVLLLLITGLLATNIEPSKATHGGPWHWAMRNPVVVDGTSHEASQKANKFAVDNWNAIHADIQLMYRTDNTICTRKPHKYEISVCYRNLDHEGGEAWVWTDGSDGPNHTTSAEVYYNPEARNRTQYSLDALACHELGHTLGFAHWTDPNEGCMHPATQKDRPGVHDAADLRTLYAHTDQYGHAQPGPEPSPDPDPDPPPPTCTLPILNRCWWARN